MLKAIVLQARNSSTRYPRKMMHQFLGRPAIAWVMDRAGMSDVDMRILVTSENEEDDILEDIARAKGWSVVRGSLDDVLSRYAMAIVRYGLDLVVRITGDCILTDYRLINYSISRFIADNADYLTLTNIIDGFDVEVIRSSAIVYANEHAFLPSDREHVTPYIKKSDRFRTFFIPYGTEDLSHIHLSLDYKDDAIAIGLILERFKNISDFSYEDVVRLIKEEPQILDSVRHIKPNEGYRISLKKDQLMERG